MPINTRLSPTLIINPTALAIVDAIFRCPPLLLSSTSPSRFALLHTLSQPRMSKVMRGLGARDLIHLKKLLTEISDAWWLSAMGYPRTRQRLTSFFSCAEFYRINAEHSLELDDLLSINREAITPGPVELAKHLGFIADPTIHLWCEAATLGKLKAALRLSPTERRDGPTIAIAVPKKSMAIESIVTTIPQYVFRKIPASLDGLNIIRAIWDLSFGDGRLREIQPEVLRMFLNEKL